MAIIACPKCQAKLKIRPEYAGRVGKCPKCQGVIRIPEILEEPGLSSAASEPGAAEENVPAVETPAQLVPWHHYVVCDRTGLFATWENNGKGWQIKSGTQMVPVRQHPDKLPSQGTFVLVELQIESTDEGHRLVGIVPYRLADRYALTKLERGPDEILKAIRGPGALNREQKVAVMGYLRSRFMREVWAGNEALRDYLTNQDYHSPGIGKPSHPWNEQTIG
ncbi:hypothetical protein JCM19992_12910 [Thermostilla marina]